MDERKIKLIVGSMLHDIGKIVYRASDGRKHEVSGEEFVRTQCGIIDEEILACIRYHHAYDFKNKKIENNNLAYITYIADNISAGADRRSKEEGKFSFDKTVSLKSVFNILNENNKDGSYQPKELSHEDGINYPTMEEVINDEHYYKKVLDSIKDKLKQFVLSEEYIQSFSEILEGYLTYIPSSTNLKELVDISLFDHLILISD